jgi:hypothetical protein
MGPPHGGGRHLVVDYVIIRLSILLLGIFLVKVLSSLLPKSLLDAIYIYT